MIAAIIIKSASLNTLRFITNTAVIAEIEQANNKDAPSNRYAREDLPAPRRKKTSCTAAPKDAPNKKAPQYSESLAKAKKLDSIQIRVFCSEVPQKRGCIQLRSARGLDYLLRRDASPKTVDAIAQPGQNRRVVSALYPVVDIGHVTAQ
jgi:hypothetical protein